MQSRAPSRTAFAAATHRAVHQILEGGRLFSDPLAVPLLGVESQTLVDYAQEDADFRRRMRIFIAMRSRFVQDELEKAAASGIRTLVVLGAGLDTSGYRPWPSGLRRVFEVDHPATQQWKRQRLTEAGIAVPESLIFAPVDFESQNLAEGLAASGFSQSEPAFFSWLGVVPYLSEEAIWSTLRFVSSCAARSQIVFDYGEPSSALGDSERAERDERARRVEAIGEPWITFFEPAALHARLRDTGFDRMEDLGPAQLLQRFFPGAARPARRSGGHVLRAVVSGVQR